MSEFTHFCQSWSVKLDSHLGFMRKCHVSSGKGSRSSLVFVCALPNMETESKLVCIDLIEYIL